MASYISGQASKRTELHKEGNYLAVVIGAEEKTSAKGSEMIELKIEVVGPDIDEGTGAILFDYLVFTEAAFFKIDQFRAACGETIVKGASVDIEADDLIGKSVEVRLVAEEYKGVKRNKVGAYLAAEAGPF